MLVPAQYGTPVSIPVFVHFLLWPALIAWAVFLFRRRRARAWPCSSRLGVALLPLCFVADSGALAAARVWPTPEADGFVFTLLWLAATVSLTTFFALRTPDDGDDGRGDREDREPPWWPDFERQFRDYTRRGPGAGSKPPRTPAGIS